MEDTEEHFVEHKFRVALNKIKLINEKPINCTLKYNYLLIGATEKNTACSFIVGCNKEWQDIPATGYEEFLLPKTTKESEVKKFLESNPIQILLFDEEVHRGTATFDLGNLLNGKAEDMHFGLRYIKQEKILGKEKFGVSENLGILECNFVLAKEDCTKCKSCGDIFKNSSIRKHISRGNCKEAYR